MNPILPDKYFVPDAEARPMPDGRLYIYGSWDIVGNGYCSTELHGFSTDDMVNWTDHGVIFRNDDEWNGVPWDPNIVLFAPDAIHKDGKYYLYVCGPGRKGNYEGVAVADSPVGPFSPAEKIELADGDGIDPTVFVDDDGKAYYFWGQFELRGGQLESDMKTLIPESINRSVLTEWEHGFHEGASIRKRGDKYYMVYTDISRGGATCLAYAMSEKPLGPYKKCGIIIDNVYCDPKTWNDHGSICCYKDKWYVFYHRSSNNSDSCRSVCVEPIEFDENGLIREVEQTSQGASGPISAFSEIRASWACRMMKECYIALENDRRILKNCGKHHWGSGDWAEYKYIDFGGGAKKAFVKVRGKGKIEFKTDNGKSLGEVEFETSDFETVSAEIASIGGVHPLWLHLSDGNFDIDSFTFE